MDVRVGYFSDPEGLEGLAHFLGNYSILFCSTSSLFQDVVILSIAVYVVICMLV